MSKYWKYSRDILRYPEIQRPGPLALLAEAEGREHDLLFEMGEKVRDQFFPIKAINEAVALHGRSRGIPRHKNESDEQYRLRVLKAFAWQAQAGRHWGMYRIFAEYGFPIITMDYLTGDRWAEFDIEVESPPGQGLDHETFDLIEWLVFEYKRASAMLRRLRIIKRIYGTLYVGAHTMTGEKLIVYPAPPVIPDIEGRLVIKAAMITHEKWTFRPTRPRMFRMFRRGLNVAAQVKG